MIIYQVNIEIKKISEESWCSWMKEFHIPDVLNTNYFNKCRFSKVIGYDLSEDESSYIIEYETDLIKKYEQYAKNDAKRLQTEHTEKFKNQFSASRKILKVLEI